MVPSASVSHLSITFPTCASVRFTFSTGEKSPMGTDEGMGVGRRRRREGGKVGGEGERERERGCGRGGGGGGRERERERDRERDRRDGGETVER
jgi:hypothetical protein